MSEQGDQWEDRDQEQQGGSSSSEQGGSGSERGGQDRQEGTEQGNRESGTGTDSSQTREEDDQSRQGDVEHEGDLGNTREQQKLSRTECQSPDWDWPLTSMHRAESPSGWE